MSLRSMFSAVTLVVAVFILYVLGVTHLYPNLITETRFQDVFAGIAAFFSALAFLGVIYAVLLQKDELGLQRKELEMTRKELQRAAQAQEKSEKALTKQAESLKVTAKLNGLSATLQHYNSQMEVVAIGKYGVSGVDQHLKKKAEEIILEINTLIEKK